MTYAASSLLERTAVRKADDPPLAALQEAEIAAPVTRDPVSAAVMTAHPAPAPAQPVGL